MFHPITGSNSSLASSSSSSSSKDTCPICLKEFPEKIWNRYGCWSSLHPDGGEKHGIHVDCCLELFKACISSHKPPTCPTCRRSLLIEDITKFAKMIHYMYGNPNNTKLEYGKDPRDTHFSSQIFINKAKNEAGIMPLLAQIVNHVESKITKPYQN